jgi:hypothetical protein
MQTHDSRSVLRAERARAIEEEKDERHDAPLFEVRSAKPNKYYHPTPDSLIHVKGSRVRVYNSPSVTAERVFANPDLDPTNVGTLFEKPTYCFYPAGDNDDEMPICGTEFCIKTDGYGRTEIIEPPIKNPNSEGYLSLSSQSQEHNSNASQERPPSGNCRQHTSTSSTRSGYPRAKFRGPELPGGGASMM